MGLSPSPTRVNLCPEDENESAVGARNHRTHNPYSKPRKKLQPSLQTHNSRLALSVWRVRVKNYGGMFCSVLERA